MLQRQRGQDDEYIVDRVRKGVAMSDDLLGIDMAGGFPNEVGTRYTVVETAIGYLYLVLIASTGKLFLDPRTLASTAKEAEEALRLALGDERFRLLTYQSPAQMLQAVMEFRVEDDDGA